jgi:hypothetical protein
LQNRRSAKPRRLNYLPLKSYENVLPSVHRRGLSAGTVICMNVDLTEGIFSTSTSEISQIIYFVDFHNKVRL